MDILCETHKAQEEPITISGAYNWQVNWLVCSLALWVFPLFSVDQF